MFHAGGHVGIAEQFVERRMEAGLRACSRRRESCSKSISKWIIGSASHGRTIQTAFSCLERPFWSLSIPLAYLPL